MANASDIVQPHAENTIDAITRHDAVVASNRAGEEAIAFNPADDAAYWDAYRRRYNEVLEERGY